MADTPSAAAAADAASSTNDPVPAAPTPPPEGEIHASTLDENIGALSPEQRDLLRAQATWEQYKAGKASIDEVHWPAAWGPRPPETSFTDELLKHAPSSAGMILGGIGGGMVAGPPGAVAGSAAGAAGGRAIERTQTFQNLTGADQPTQPAAEDLSSAALSGAENEILPAAVAGAFRKFMVEPSLSLLSRSSPKLIQDEMERFIDTLGPNLNPSELGKMWVASNRGLLRGSDVAERALYEDLLQKAATRGTHTVTNTLQVYPQSQTVTQQLPGIAVDTTKLKDAVRPVMSLLRQSNKIGATVNKYPTLQRIMSLPDQVPFAVAREIESNLGNEANVFATANKGAKGIGNLTRAKTAMQSAVEDSLAPHQDLLDLYHQAKSATAEQKSTLDNTFQRKLYKMLREGDPSEIANAVANASGPDMENILQGVPPTDHPSIARYWINSKVRAATTDPAEPPSGALLEKSLHPNTANPHDLEVMKQLFTPSERQQMLGFAKDLKASQSSKLNGMVKLTQEGAVIEAMMNPETGALQKAQQLGMIFLGPAALAKMMTSREGNLALRRGLKMSATASMALPTASKLLVAARNAQSSLNDHEQASDEAVKARMGQYFGGQPTEGQLAQP